MDPGGEPDRGPEILHPRRREALEQLDHWSQAGLNPRQFWSGFLKRLTGALDAAAAAVWIVDGVENVALHYQLNLPEVTDLSRRELQRWHEPHVRGVARERRALSVDELIPARLPLVLAPVIVAGQSRYVVEIVLNGQGAAPAEVDEFLRAACDVAARYVAENGKRGIVETPRAPASKAQVALQWALVAVVSGLTLLLSLHVGFVVAALLVGFTFFQGSRRRDEA